MAWLTLEQKKEHVKNIEAMALAKGVSVNKILQKDSAGRSKFYSYRAAIKDSPNRLNRSISNRIREDLKPKRFSAALPSQGVWLELLSLQLEQLKETVSKIKGE